ERDGHFYGRGTTDDKAMAAAWISAFIRMRQEDYKPDRDLIIALTADEEGGDYNGVQWLLKNYRDLVDAAFAVNEGSERLIKYGRQSCHRAAFRAAVRECAAANDVRRHSTRGRTCRQCVAANGARHRELPVAAR